jgi:hypothetical protein
MFYVLHFKTVPQSGEITRDLSCFHLFYYDSSAIDHHLNSPNPDFVLLPPERVVVQRRLQHEIHVWTQDLPRLSVEIKFLKSTMKYPERIDCLHKIGLVRCATKNVGDK